MMDCHVFLPCGGTVRDVIMPESLDRAHWEFWALRIPITTLLIEGMFKCPLLTSACSVIFSGQNAFMTLSPQYYCLCLYDCLYSVCGPVQNFRRKCSSAFFFFVHFAGQDLTFDSTGQRSYMVACEKLHVVPSSAFLQQIQSNEMLLMHRCLGPQVSCDQAEAFSWIFPS